MTRDSCAEDLSVTLPSRRTLLTDLVILLAVILIADWRMLLTSEIPFAEDVAYFFLPMFDLLGRSLKEAVVLDWNPYQAAGIPFTPGPQVGWGAVLPMISFAALPSLIAFRVLQVTYLFIAAAGAYLLGSIKGMRREGALGAGLVFGISGFMFSTQENLAYLQTFAPLLLTLVLVELAVGERRRARWLLYATLAGFIVRQQMLIWPGQGTLYIGLPIMAYALYSGWSNTPVESSRSRRLLQVLALLTRMGAASLLLNAWSLLPKVLFIVLSKLSYPGWTVPVDGAPAEPLRVNYTLPGVRVAQGSHTVVWSYSPPGRGTGSLITLTTIATALVVLGSRFAFNRLHRATSPRRSVRTLPKGL